MSDAKTACPQCNATITDWVFVNPELAVFRVRLDGGQVPQFKPGQFATLALPRLHPPILKPDEFPPDDPRWQKLIRRQYSIASSPNERAYLEFYIVLVPDGALTPKLWQAGNQGRVCLEQRIAGEFTLDPVPQGRNIVLIATGTGLAPYVSMLKTFRGTGRWSRLVIMHGVRLAADLGYRRELETIAAQDPSVVYLPSCTREPQDSAWRGPRGRIPQYLQPTEFRKLAGFDLDPNNTNVFICGNPEMINQVEADLKTRGFSTHGKKNPQGNIHLERYW